LHRHDPTPLEIQRWEDDGGAVPSGVTSDAQRRRIGSGRASFGLVRLALPVTAE
jgi:hypothetical protein